MSHVALKRHLKKSWFLLFLQRQAIYYLLSELQAVDLIYLIDQIRQWISRDFKIEVNMNDSQ